MPKGRKADRKIVEQKKPKMFEPTSTYDVPKTKLKKGGVQYKEGDRVHISYTDGDYEGVIQNILSSQIIVRLDENDPNKDKFFFTTGLKLKKC
jgi:hypothetical protein